MASEQYIPLPSSVSLPLDTALAHLSYEEGTLRLVLVCNHQKEVHVEVIFEDAVFFSVSDEGDRMRSLDAMSQVRAARIFEAIDSRLSEWFSAETYGAHSPKSISHYVILTVDDWIDVLALSAPKVQEMTD